MTWPAMTGEGIAGVFEWKLGRSCGWSGDGRVPSPLQARVLTALFGAWVGARGPGCQPLRGKHPDDCPHRLNVVPIRLGPLSEAVLGYSGGSQTRQVRRAIMDLAERRVSYRPVAATRMVRSFPRSCTLSSVRSQTDELADMLRFDGVSRRPDLVVAFDDGILESMLAGHYQRVPLTLVQGLFMGDYLIWLATLCQVAVGKLKPGGKPARFSVTGRWPGIDRRLLGAATLSPRELRDAIERAARAGNDLQSEYIRPA